MFKDKTLALLLGFVPTRLFLTHRCISVSWWSGTGSLWFPSVISRNPSARPPYCSVCWRLKTPVSINRNLSLFFSNQNITFGVWLHLLKGNSLNIQRRVLSRVSMIWIAVSVADLWKEVTESNSRSKLFGLWRQQLINHSHCFPSDTAEYRVLRNDGDITTLCLCWVMERGDTSFLCSWMTSGELRSTAIK